MSFSILITIEKNNKRSFKIKKLHVNKNKLTSKCNGRPQVYTLNYWSVHEQKLY